MFSFLLLIIIVVDFSGLMPFLGNAGDL